MHHLIPRAAVAVTLCAAAGAAEAEFASGFAGEIGLRYGHELAHLDAPLNADRRYLHVTLQAGVSSSLGPIEGSFGAAARWSSTRPIPSSTPADRWMAWAS